jgi:hypothetical protein
MTAHDVRLPLPTAAGGRPSDGDVWQKHDLQHMFTIVGSVSQ